jgi:hypothetical protein
LLPGRQHLKYLYSDGFKLIAIFLTVDLGDWCDFADFCLNHLSEPGFMGLKDYQDFDR